MSSAEQLVGIVAAASEAIEGWFAIGDASRVREGAAGVQKAAREALELGREAEGLLQAVPAPVLRVVSERLSRHWTAYERALEEQPDHAQAQAIHFALLACMSKELERIREHEPSLPPGVMKRWWVEYS